MNQEAGQRLRQAKPNTAIRSEILKAPHHGSADFDMEFLKEVAAVVSLISSGDESEAKEYIHPRATLMAALGKAGRTTRSIIFCTELAVFFSVLGYVENPKKPCEKVFAFERTNFGISHIRTDGERVLAFTHSGKKFLNEAYRFTVSPTGEVAFVGNDRNVRTAQPATRLCIPDMGKRLRLMHLNDLVGTLRRNCRPEASCCNAGRARSDTRYAHLGLPRPTAHRIRGYPTTLWSSCRCRIVQETNLTPTHVLELKFEDVVVRTPSFCVRCLVPDRRRER